jgi:glucosamine kinase
MNEIYSRPLVIGIDAGGTRCRAHLTAAGPGGAVLGRGSGGPGNALSVGRADLTRHLADAIAGALPPGPAVRSRVAAAFGGFAGAAVGLGPERGHALAVSCLRDALAANGISGAAVGVGGDAEIALAAAPGAPADGLVLIAGTGALASRLTGRRPACAIDGHGWLLGDEGSGFWLGNRAVRAALEALDGRGPWTTLVHRVMAHFLVEGAVDVSTGALARHAVTETIVSRAYEQAPPRLAALSPVAAAAAQDGDAVALTLLDTAADLLTAKVRALRPRPGEPLVTTGGLLGPTGPLHSRVTARLAPFHLDVHPVPDGSPGAAALASTLL